MPIPRPDSPYDLFREWWSAGHDAEPKYPDGVSLATIGEDRIPAVRVVLLRDWDERGFVFYTNYEGAKGRDLMARPVAALCAYWKTLDRQIRIRGTVEVAEGELSDAYFAGRPRESQIGAWASHQSSIIAGRDELMRSVEEMSRRFAGQPVPRPPHWGGFRVKPVQIEYWQEGEFRLHDRLQYTQGEDGSWSSAILSP